MGVKTNKKKVLLLVILLLFFFVLYLLLKEESSYEIGISNEFIKQFMIEKSSESYDTTIFNGEYKDKLIKIKILNNFNLEKAENYISDKLFVINSLYRGIHSPYPGDLSNRIECSNEFKPLKISNNPFDYHIVYASDRFTYGACSFDLIKYKSLFFFFYCENIEQFYQIELFIPINEDTLTYENSLKSIKCLK